MKTLIDETYMLRYVLQDEKEMFELASALIAGGQAYTYPEYIARTAITLRDVYRVPRSQIAYVLNMLLDDVFVVDEDVVRCANRLFGTTILDYLGCLSAARSIVRGESIASFEKPLLGRVLNQQM